MDELLLIRRCQAGDRAACDMLIAKHEPWIRQRARKFAVTGVDWDDLMQEGRLGLYRAIIKYDENNGANLLTYADLWIPAHPVRGVRREEDHPIRFRRLDR